METFGFSADWFADACFPAAALAASGAHPHLAPPPNVRGVEVSCADAAGLKVNGVRYGRACIDNPPCNRMSFLPARHRPALSCNSSVVDPLVVSDRKCGERRVELALAGNGHNVVV